MSGLALVRWLPVWLVVPAFLAAGKEEVAFESGQLALRVKTWTTDDGMPVHAIQRIKQTRDGYLWLGTYYGLTRFDGVRPETFRLGNNADSETITALAVDRDGALWIGTREGLVRYRNRQFQKIGVREGLFDPLVWRVASCSQGGVYVQSEERVFHYREGRFTEIFSSTNFPFGPIINLEEGEGGRANVMTPRAWLEIGENGLLHTNAIRPDPGAAWTAARLGRVRGECWVASNTGVSRVHRTDGSIEPIKELGTNSFGFVQEDNTGNLWVGGESSFLGLREGENWRRIDLGSQLMGSIQCLEQDHEGNTWLGTEQGLVRFRTALGRSYTRRDGLSDNYVYSVCEGTDGTIWLGTRRGLSAISPGGQPQNWRIIEPGSTHDNRSVWPNLRGGVFVAKESGGLFEYQDGQFTPRFQYLDGSPLPTALWENSSGHLAMATSASVMLLGGTEPDRRIYVETEYQVPEARGAVENADGTLWLATKGHGLARVERGSIRYFTATNGLSNNNVWSLHRASDGALWLGTDAGLTRLLNGRFSVVGMREGLLENNVNCLLEDDFGYFWLAGLKGFYRIRATHLKAAADGRIRNLQVRTFGTADGMEAVESNGETQPAGWKGRDGRLWFATIRGVVVIDPQRIDPREAPPEVVFEQVKANETVIWGDGAISSENRKPGHGLVQIPAGKGQTLEFRFTANTFAASDRIRFKCRLVGVDSDWRDAKERTATYRDLRPNKYTFEVIAGNHHNLWSERSSKFAVQLNPHFWQTWAFYVLCGFFGVAVIGSVLVYRLRWQRRLLKMEEQKALAIERTRIARDLHDDLGTALTGLALELDVIGRDSSTGASRLFTRLSEAAGKARALAERMREVVWTVNPRCDTVSSLADFLQDQASQFFRGTDMMVRLDFPEDIPELPIGAEARHQLALSVREGLNNIVRHAGASEVVLGLAIDGGNLTVQIRDNGKGFQAPLTPGLGLENMRARLQQAGGTFVIHSVPGRGTVLSFQLPLENGAGPARAAFQ